MRGGAKNFDQFDLTSQTHLLFHAVSVRKIECENTAAPGDSIQPGVNVYHG